VSQAPPALSFFDAVSRGAKCPRTNTGKESSGDKLYLVDKKAKKVLVGPEENQQDLKRDADAKKIPFDATEIVTVPQGVVLVRAEQSDPKAKPSNLWYVLKDQPVLNGTKIKNPEQGFDNGPGENGQPNVTFDFANGGGSVWQKFTRKLSQRGSELSLTLGGGDSANQHFAIALDNELISVPQIDYKQYPDGIDPSGGSRISGGFDIGSAQRLANLLKSGALPIKLQLISASQVSATLGKQALHQGLIAGLAGFIVVALFLLAFYRVLGLIAVGALLVYAIFFFALIKLIPITLTLPGIAGLILTIGVAADANIVIFERVKEELRGGRSIPAAIATGYRRGLSAIIDANVVTFMVAFILFLLATAGVKGFAFTLGVGTLVSFFTAVLLTQAVLGTMSRSRLIHSPAALGAGRRRERRRFDYMGASRWFFSMSGVILLIGALAIGGKGLNFGIDFKSGTRVRTELNRAATENQVRDAISPNGFADAEIQRLSGSGAGRNSFQISTKTLNEGQRGAIQHDLQKSFGVKSFDYDTIGPTFGQTVAKSAVIAIIASLLVISIYIALRFEWKYSVPVFIALMHDLLITSGVYSLLGREVTTSTVAALLTILGYSLYDTIIVFDRVRENVPRMPRAAFTQIVNRSMGEVITRSLATSFCTALPILALLLFGGDTLKDFAFALLIGVISGTYSSIFIASPVLTHWKEREPVYMRRRRRIAEANDGVVPAYATSVGGAAVDVQPEEKVSRRGRITQPEDPQRGVSQAEFDEMVRDLHPDDVPQRTATKEREPEPEPEPDRAADLAPEDLVLKDDKAKRAPKQRRPRNRRHGRSR
jgi:SecD/SecF fusion protein